jgi:hypothetical protein
MSVSSLKSPCGLYVCSWKLIVVASSRISCTPSWSGEFQFLLCPSSLVAVRVSFPDSSRFPDDEKFVRVVFLSQKAGLTQYARFFRLILSYPCRLLRDADTANQMPLAVHDANNAWSIVRLAGNQAVRGSSVSFCPIHADFFVMLTPSIIFYRYRGVIPTHILRGAIPRN